MNSACGLVITAPLHSEGLRFEYSASVCFFALFFLFSSFSLFFFLSKNMLEMSRLTRTCESDLLKDVAFTLKS